MKIKTILDKLDEVAPPVQFEPSVKFGIETEETEKLGVCVDPTVQVMEEAIAKGIGMIISHHYPTKMSEAYAREHELYAIVAHLRQDIAFGGNIETLAELLQVINLVPITIEYKGMVVENGAVAGDFGTYPDAQDDSEGPLGIEEKFLYQIAGNVRDGLREFDLKPQIKVYKASDRRVRRIAISAGAALKGEFVEQVAKHNVEAFLAAEMEQPAIMVAQELGISLIDIGHYESEVPGMQTLADRLGAEFIPNRYEFSGG